MIKILCPTDFSEVARNAIAYAAKFSKETGADLTLYYIEPLEERNQRELLRGKAMTIEAESEILEEQCEEIRAAFHISCNGQVQPSSGPVPQLISTMAEDFDLVIMGTHGADDLYKSFLGSNTYRVIQSASVPVLYVPDGYSYSKIESITYAFDYLHDYKLPLGQLKPWIRKFNSKLTVLLVTRELDSHKEYELKEIQRQLQNQYQDDMNIKFETLIDKSVAECIDRYMIEKETELLALCTHHYDMWENLFHKSIIKAISSKAEYPVLVFHK